MRKKIQTQSDGMGGYYQVLAEPVNPEPFSAIVKNPADRSSVVRKSAVRKKMGE